MISRPAAMSSDPTLIDCNPHIQEWLAAIVDGSTDAIIGKDLNGSVLSWNRAAERLFGYTADEIVGRPITLVIPEDRLHEELHILGQIRLGKRIEHFETVRRRKDGELIDLSLTVSPIRSSEGVVVGASKIARDITAAKHAQEQQALLMAEMQHRVKNLFALASGLVTFSSRTADSVAELVEKVQSRLGALAAAHDLTMKTPLSASSESIRIQDLLQIILEPYSCGSRPFNISGINPVIVGSALTNLALLLHELTTNAVKYGALSSGDGKLNVSVETWQDKIRVIWEECACHQIDQPSTAGFGGRLLIAVTTALNASAETEWRPTGLRLTLDLPTSNFLKGTFLLA